MTKRLFVLVSVALLVLFLVYAPSFPSQDTWVTGHRAQLVCAALGEFCLSNPQFLAHNPGYASATYLLFRFGTGPTLHYPVEITVYFTNASTNVTTLANVFLKDDHTACVDTSINQPQRCVGP